MEYSKLMQFLEAGGYVGDDETYSGTYPEEIWDHFEVMAGRRITDRPTYFYCSC